MNVWEQVLTHIKTRVPRDTFHTWFRPTRLIAVKGKLLAVRIPDGAFRQWLEENAALVGEALAAVGLDEHRVEYVTEPPAPPPAVQTRLDFDSVDYQLNPRYTFARFVVAGCNQFAHAASVAVAEQPSRAYNPLFLYGGVGLGKTHLMQAVGHAVKKHFHSLRVIYLSAEKFTNDVINALRFERLVGFRDKYRTVDVLLIDDIQFLAGKERTQEEFFHTFNALYDAQKQIVISSDSPPKEIPTLEERLRSRFEWGLITDLQAPDLETRMAILMRKAESESVALPQEVAEHIAKGVKSNIRELEGALTRLVAYAALRGVPITVPLAQDVLRNFLVQQERRVPIELIQRRVGEHFGLHPNDLKAKSNARAVAYPRQVAMYLARELTGASLPEIGRAFNGKHHTTVLHSVQKISARRKTDRDLSRLLDKLADTLR